MSESIAAGIAAEGAAAEVGETRIPSNLYALVREGYERREKVLDWIIAAFLAGILIWSVRGYIRNLIPGLPDAGDGPNAGRDDAMQPNQNVTDALPSDQKAMARVYTYNLPPSRTQRYDIGPSGTKPPDDPSAPPFFPAINETC